MPHKDAEGKKLSVEKTVRNTMFVSPDLEKLPLGGRLRFLRKRQGLTIVDLEQRTGVSRATICKLERGKAGMRPDAMGKLLSYFRGSLADAFPEGADAFDLLAPVSDFGSWLRNFRIRKGLRQFELAKIIGVCKASISAYEMKHTRPQDPVLKRLKEAFKLNGEFDQFL
ncbi:MAG: helix-turn-helix transcriptional regulator [Elusimicrobiota bacterium]